MHDLVPMTHGLECHSVECWAWDVASKMNVSAIRGVWIGEHDLESRGGEVKSDVSRQSQACRHCGDDPYCCIGDGRLHNG